MCKSTKFSGLLALWLAFGVTQANSSAAALKEEMQPAGSSSSSSVSLSETYELTLLSDLPNKLSEILTTHDLKDSRLMIYLDFDDVLAHREYMVRVGDTENYQFHYLASAEAFRMISPVLEKIMNEKEANKDQYKSLNTLYKELFYKSGTLSYRYPESIPFQETLEALRKMGSTVKILSGLPLDPKGVKLDYIKTRLGLSEADYMFSKIKFDGIAQHITADYEAQKSSGATVNPNYVAVLLDNCRGSKWGTSSIDTFVPGMNAQKVQEGVKVVPFAVYSDRLMTEVERDKKMIEQEIDSVFKLNPQDASDSDS